MGNDEIKITGTELHLDKLLEGLESEDAPERVMFDGEVRSREEVIELVKDRRAIYKEAREAKALAKAKVAAKKAARKQNREFVSDMRAAIVQAVGKRSAKLPKFGIPQQKERKPLTIEKLQERTVKSNVTRKLRGTLGPRQKEGLKSGPVRIVTHVEETTGPTNVRSTSAPNGRSGANAPSATRSPNAPTSDFVAGVPASPSTNAPSVPSSTHVPPNAASGARDGLGPPH